MTWAQQSHNVVFYLILNFFSESLELNEALKRVLKSAMIVDGVARGLNEAARTLDRFRLII